MASQIQVARSYGLLRKFYVGYLPYTAFAIAVAYLTIYFSRSWEAIIAGGLFFLLWSVLIVVSQLVILFLKLNSRFYLKCLAVTIFSLFGSPFVIAAIDKAGAAIFMGKPNLHQFLIESGAAHCEIRAVESEHRVGRDAYQISAVVSCPGSGEQHCAWWFHYRDKKWIPSLTPSAQCPKSGG